MHRRKDLEKEYQGIFYEELFTEGESGVRVSIIFNVHDDGCCTVSLSSGKKRKYLDIWEDKNVKNKGTGIGLLLKVKSCIENIDSLTFQGVDGYAPSVNKIVVEWSDSRRRKIYERGLTPIGFRFDRYNGVKCLMKRLS